MLSTPPRSRIRAPHTMILPDSSERAHGPCALLHAPRALVRSLLATGLAFGFLSGCDASHAENGREETPGEKIEILVEALTPLDQTWTSDVKDAWLQNTIEKVGIMKNAGPEVGREALRVLREEGHEAVGVEVGLLTVAAHADPVGTQPYLEELIFEYGYAMHQRAEAVKLLGEIAPNRAIELYDPHLRDPRQRKTYPDAEFFVRSYIKAANEVEHDPVDLLADVTTNIWHQDAARHFAVRELGNHPSEIGRQALHITLIESTGNGYLRRLAAQSLRNSLPREQACQIFAEVANKEASRNFLAFLIDIINENCK